MFSPEGLSRHLPSCLLASGNSCVPIHGIPLTGKKVCGYISIFIAWVRWWIRHLSKAGPCLHWCIQANVFLSRLKSLLVLQQAVWVQWTVVFSSTWRGLPLLSFVCVFLAESFIPVSAYEMPLHWCCHRGWGFCHTSKRWNPAGCISNPTGISCW